MFARRRWILVAAGVGLVAAVGGVTLGDSLPRGIYRKYDAETLLAQYARQQPAPKPLLIVDIDDTLMKFETTDKFRFLFRVRSRKIKTLEGAPDAIRALQPSWNVVILTARDDVFKERTLRWLDQQRFPGVPVVFSPTLQPGQTRQEHYKRQAIMELKARGLRPAVGVGNSVGDAHAYLSSGMRAFILVDDRKDTDFVRISEGLEKDPALKPFKDRLHFFERSEPTPVWEQIVEELEK